VIGDHLIVLHSAVRACPGYSRHDAPSILLDGASVARDTEHGRAVTAQLTRRHGTLEEAIDAGNFALSAAGVAKAVRRQARAACEDYFYNRLGLSPELELNPRAPLPRSLEPMPDAMYRALENIVELIVDGDYEELHELSSNQLRADDLRRRLEDEVPEPLALPPREHYGVEAITPSEDLDEQGWSFFLQLWTDNGPSRLHIEGLLLLTADERFLVALTDVLP
jgi:hypothetical protein